MALDGSRLETAEQAAIRAELEAQVKPTIDYDNLTASEKALMQAGWDKLANAMAAGAPETIDEITGNAQVSTTGTTTGVQSGPSTAPTTSTGTVS